MSTTTYHQTQLSELKRDWIEKTSREVIGLGRAGQLEIPGGWSTDELHVLVSEAPYEKNWWGCMTARMRNLGWIVRMGSKPSKREEANGRWIATWRFDWSKAPAGLDPVPVTEANHRWTQIDTDEGD